MDYFSLLNEYESYKSYIENSTNSMNHIFNFFSNFQKNLNDFSTITQKNLNDLFSNLLKFDTKSTHIKKFFAVFRLFEGHLIKLSTIAKKINNELVQPTNDFTKFLSNNNNSQLIEFQKLKDSVNYAKSRYEKMKHNYLDSCRHVVNQENQILKEIENNNDQKYISYQNSLLMQLRLHSQEERQKYNNEFNIINTLYEGSNKKYFNIINIFKDNEEKRINYLSFHLEKFISFLNDEKNSLENLINTINQEDANKNMFKIKLTEDMKNYQEKFNFCRKKNIRFINEELILYEVYKKNVENIINNSNKLIQNNENVINNINSRRTSIANNLSASYNKDVFNFESVNIKLQKDEQEIFDILFDGDISDPSFPKKKFTDFEKKLISDVEFSESIIDKMLGEIFQGPIYYEFKNLKKFEYVKQILLDISMNNKVRNEIIEMNLGIIYIAEKGYYFDSDNNIKKYLSKELSEGDNNFKSQYFWKDLLKHKVDSTLKRSVKNELEKISNYQKNKNSKYNALYKDIDISDKTFLEKITQEIYEKEIINILKDFMLHFTNFNLDMQNINDILIDISSDYSLSSDDISYLLSFVNSNTYSIRGKYHTNSKKIINKYLYTKKIENTNNKKLKHLLLTINSCFIFLYPKDYINLRCVNKYYYKTLEKTIYKQIFIKNFISIKNNFNYKLLVNNFDDILIDKQKHIDMWFNYLKYDYKSISYEDILIKAKDNQKISTLLDIINLDVLRTFFESDQETNRNKIKNILTAIAHKYPQIGYCQGMNYISQFLLMLIEDEEKAFDIFSAIINKTDYSKLIINDFDLMKKYFYVFERLTCIFLPELYTTFKRNNVNANYYISPWFITLYTHSFSGNHTKILLYIFDLFVLDGWLAIIRIGLMLLKFYEKDLINMEFEELLHFLINQLKEKYDFFNNNNYEKFIEMYHNVKLPKGLLSNIENEYEINKKRLSKQKQKD